MNNRGAITALIQARDPYEIERDRLHELAFQDIMESGEPDDFLAKHEVIDKVIRSMEYGYSAVASFWLRNKLTREFSWAVPNKEALDTLDRLGPIVEMGAGAGYWAYLLRKRGVQVEAFDKVPAGTKTNTYTGDKLWTEVLEGCPEDLKTRSESTLFLCWPDYNTTFGSECLAAYGGNTVVYVGEDEGGCTGDAGFHEALETFWDLKRTVRIPQWEGLHDCMRVYQRRQ